MNIIVVNPFGIGDVLFATPLIHTIKAVFPRHRVGFMCNARSAPLLKNNPYIDEVIIYERDDFEKIRAQSWWKWCKAFTGLISTIKRGSYEAAIDLSLAPQFGFFLMLSGVKKRIGYNYKKRGYLLTHSLPLTGYEDRHIVEYYAGLLELLGLKPQYRELELFIDKNDEAFAEKFFTDNSLGSFKTVFVIAPGGGASWGQDAQRKHWPYEKYTFLIDKIVEKYKAAIIIVGSNKEDFLSARLIQNSRNNVFDITGKTSVGQLAAVINKSDIFIGNDGGPLHIAAALKKKTISFFGPVSPLVYGPYPPDAEKHIVLKESLNCSPCYQQFRLQPCQRNRKCLLNIEPEQAVRAVGKLLRF